MPENVVAKLSPRRPVYRGAMIDVNAFAVGRLITVMRSKGEIPTVEEGRKMLREVATKYDMQVPLERIYGLEMAGENGTLKARHYTDSVDKVQPAMVFSWRRSCLLLAVLKRCGLAQTTPAWAVIVRAGQ